MNSKQLLAIFCFLLLLPIAMASYTKTTTWDDIAKTTNGSTCTALTKIGDGYSKQLETLSYTNATVNGAECLVLKVFLGYGSSSTVTSLTNTTPTTATVVGVSTISAKYVRACFNASSVNATCSITNIALTYTPSGTISPDLIAGLPSVASDTSSFLKNLAPGIGTFIIIMGVFTGVGALIYGIVVMIKGKVQV